MTRNGAAAFTAEAFRELSYKLRLFKQSRGTVLKMFTLSPDSFAALSKPLQSNGAVRVGADSMKELNHNFRVP
mgnify:CR=1 FL=1